MGRGKRRVVKSRSKAGGSRSPLEIVEAKSGKVKIVKAHSLRLIIKLLGGEIPDSERFLSEAAVAHQKRCREMLAKRNRQLDMYIALHKEEARLVSAIQMFKHFMERSLPLITVELPSVDEVKSWGSSPADIAEYQKKFIALFNFVEIFIDDTTRLIVTTNLAESDKYELLLRIAGNAIGEVFEILPRLHLLMDEAGQSKRFQTVFSKLFNLSASYELAYNESVERRRLTPATALNQDYFIANHINLSFAKYLLQPTAVGYAELVYLMLLERFGGGMVDGHRISLRDTARLKWDGIGKDPKRLSQMLSFARREISIDGMISGDEMPAERLATLTLILLTEPIIRYSGLGPVDAIRPYLNEELVDWNSIESLGFLCAAKRLLEGQSKVADRFLSIAYMRLPDVNRVKEFLTSLKPAQLKFYDDIRSRHSRWLQDWSRFSDKELALMARDAMYAKYGTDHFALTRSQLEKLAGKQLQMNLATASYWAKFTTAELMEIVGCDEPDMSTVSKDGCLKRVLDTLCVESEELTRFDMMQLIVSESLKKAELDKFPDRARSSFPTLKASIAHTVAAARSETAVKELEEELEQEQAALKAYIQKQIASRHDVASPATLSGASSGSISSDEGAVESKGDHVLTEANDSALAEDIHAHLFTFEKSASTEETASEFMVVPTENDACRLIDECYWSSVTDPEYSLIIRPSDTYSAKEAYEETLKDCSHLVNYFTRIYQRDGLSGNYQQIYAQMVQLENQFQKVEEYICASADVNLIARFYNINSNMYREYGELIQAQFSKQPEIYWPEMVYTAQRSYECVSRANEKCIGSRVSLTGMRFNASSSRARIAQHLLKADKTKAQGDAFRAKGLMPRRSGGPSKGPSLKTRQYRCAKEAIPELRRIYNLLQAPSADFGMVTTPFAGAGARGVENHAALVLPT